MVRSTLRPPTMTPTEADRMIQRVFGYSGREEMDSAQVQPLPHYALHMAVQIIDGSLPGGVNIAALVEGWRAVDASRRGPGGRPAYISLRAVLILRLAHAIAYRPQTVRHMADTVTMTFGSEEMATLGIVDDDADGAVWYQRLDSANSLLVKTMDPEIFPDYRASDPTPLRDRLNRHRRLTDMQLAELKVYRSATPELIAELRARLDDYLFAQNANVIRLVQSVGLLDSFNGDVALDATYIQVFGRATYKNDTRAGSTNPEAGLWGRGGDHAVDVGKAKKTSKKFKFGFEADIVTITRGNSNLIPELILGVNVHAPGKIGDVSDTVFRRIAELGLRRGHCAVDRAYNNLNVDRFHRVMAREGYELVLDYPLDELGSQAKFSHKGVGYLMVDGTWYLSLIPEELATCTSDHFARESTDPRWIDQETMVARIESRRAYQLHRHGRRDSEGFQRYTLPDPTGYTAFDPLTGELLDKPTTKTVTIPMTIGERWAQKYPFRSPEWTTAFNLRSGIERKNREVKHGNFIDLESADRRPQRGIAANAIAVAMYITSANLTTLDNFLRTAEGIDTTKSPRRRKSRRRDDLKVLGVAKQQDRRTTAGKRPNAA